MTVEQLDDDTDDPPPPVKTVRVLTDQGFIYVPANNAPHWDERRWHPRAR